MLSRRHSWFKKDSIELLDSTRKIRLDLNTEFASDIRKTMSQGIICTKSVCYECNHSNILCKLLNCKVAFKKQHNGKKYNWIQLAGHAGKFSSPCQLLNNFCLINELNSARSLHTWRPGRIHIEAARSLGKKVPGNIADRFSFAVCAQDRQNCPELTR